MTYITTQSYGEAPVRARDSGPAPAATRARATDTIRTRSPGSPGKVIEVPPICIGKPDFRLDRFLFDKATLRRDETRNHFCEIDCIAREIVRRWSTPNPVRHVCLVGHTDEIGAPGYNFDLGKRRARAVKDELCNALQYHARCANRQDIFATLTIAVTSAGEHDPRVARTTGAARELNRRVHVYLFTDPSPGEMCPAPPAPRPPPVMAASRGASAQRRAPV